MKKEHVSTEGELRKRERERERERETDRQTWGYNKELFHNNRLPKLSCAYDGLPPS